MTKSASRLATLDRGNPNFVSANTEISAIAQPEAAELLNVSREYEGHDPIGFVLSLNLKRRHLDTAQRAMVASRLANMRQGARTDLTEISAMSQPEAAKLLNVSADSVQFARKVLDQGSETLIQRVDVGGLAVSTAAKIAELPEEEQVEIVALQAEPLIAARAKERQSCGQGGVLLSANLPEAKPIDTRDELSTMSGVSARNISKVKNILESGSEDLVTQVRSGNVSINAAETIATLPKEKQAKMVARGKKEI